jgi:outer membrane beta-barrel protein
MILRRLLPLVLAATTLSPQWAFAQELIERVVVRQRLYTVAERFELSPTVGFTIVNRLTDHINPNLGLAYNLSETLALELRGGYAISRHTGLARQVAEHLLQRPPNREVAVTDDLTNLWEMKGNGALGVRWAPIYGKISLMAELPVHFQTYLWAGGGAGNFFRESVVYCQRVGDRASGICGNVTTDANGDRILEPGTSAYLQESKVTWLATAALGFRFFTHPKGALRTEVRSYHFPDSYLVDINRATAEAGGTTGEPARDPGITNLVLFDLGYSFIF